MKYEGNDRYQFQPWYVKAYRWLRHRPLWAIRAVTVLVYWLFVGAPVPPYCHSRRQTIGHIWTVYASHAAMKMGHYYDHDEVVAELLGHRK